MPIGIALQVLSWHCNPAIGGVENEQRREVREFRNRGKKRR